MPKTNPEFWVEKIEKNQTRDARVQIQLKAIGWTALIVWECEIKNPAVLKEKLIGFLDRNESPIVSDKEP